jgi:hypothetical protein
MNPTEADTLSVTVVYPVHVRNLGRTLRPYSGLGQVEEFFLE